MVWHKDYKKKSGKMSSRGKRVSTGRYSIQNKTVTHNVASRDLFEKALDKAYHANEEAWKNLAKK